MTKLQTLPLDVSTRMINIYKPHHDRRDWMSFSTPQDVYNLTELQSSTIRPSVEKYVAKKHDTISKMFYI